MTAGHVRAFAPASIGATGTLAGGALAFVLARTALGAAS